MKWLNKIKRKYHTLPEENKKLVKVEGILWTFTGFSLLLTGWLWFLLLPVVFYGITIPMFKNF